MSRRDEEVRLYFFFFFFFFDNYVNTRTLKILTPKIVSHVFSVIVILHRNKSVFKENDGIKSVISYLTFWFVS